jgi:zinc transport system permease protein
MDDFIVRAVLAGIGIALVAGPFGCFVVWRRMAFFGDTLAHSALLGIALGYLSTAPTGLTVTAICLLIAVLLAGLSARSRVAGDTLLGILAHSSLATGLVAIAFMEGLRVDLLDYLFGDVLSVTLADLAWIWFGGTAVLFVLAAFWRPLLSATVDEDLARVEGVRAELLRFGFIVLMAVVIAGAMKIVGVLLVTALLIIPAATARRFAATPEAMAFHASMLGVIAVLLGIGASVLVDTPSGPSIVVAAAIMFAVSLIGRSRAA